MRYFAIFALIIALAILAGCGGDNSSLVTRPSGLQYRDVAVGTGDLLTNGTTIAAYTTMKLENGTKTYDSREKSVPDEIAVGGGRVLDGIEEGMIGMRIGGRRLMTIPSELAFGSAGNPSSNVPPNATITCDLEALAKRITTQSGLKYDEIAVGTGDTPETGDRLRVHYTGRLTDGTVFDSSVERDQPFEFNLGQNEVIDGWDEGLATMKVGGKRRLVVPPELGYGSQEKEKIPANSTLVFEVELLAIVQQAGS